MCDELTFTDELNNIDWTADVRASYYFVCFSVGSLETQTVA